MFAPLYDSRVIAIDGNRRLSQQLRQLPTDVGASGLQGGRIFTCRRPTLLPSAATKPGQLQRGVA
jgi:hypothetical protein